MILCRLDMLETKFFKEVTLPYSIGAVICTLLFGVPGAGFAMLVTALFFNYMVYKFYEKD